MQNKLTILKGIHPGALLERELKKHNLSKRQFALSINEFPQTIGAIIKGKRDMNIPLSLKIEKALSLEEGFLMTLQVFYSIKKLSTEQTNIHPNITKFRKALFWDTDIHKINWMQQKKAVIKRVFERGNEIEKKEIQRFYGKQAVIEVLKTNNIK
jgi:antitoxin HigA-1